MATTKKTPHHNIFKFKRSDLTIIPMLALVAFGISTALGNFQVLHVGVLHITASLLVVAFAVLYIYKTLKRTTNIYATVLAYFFCALLIFGAFVLWSVSDTQLCSGFFGVQESCRETRHFQLEAAFFNPYSLLVISVLSISGIIALFIRPRKVK